MSAFVVSKSHIDALVRAGLEQGKCQGYKLSWYATNPQQAYAAAGGGEDGWAAMHSARRKLDHTTTEQVGQMLFDECVRSVSYRYSDNDDLPGTYTTEGVPEWTLPYSFPVSAMMRPAAAPVAILKAISCYEYQSCEHGEWESSEAKAFCDALRDHMIHMLPGYDDAEWEIDS